MSYRESPIVLWDGECAFCRRSVEWLRAHDRSGKLEFCPFQQADLSSEMHINCEKAVHLIKSDGEILRAGRAMLWALRFTKWHQIARILNWPIFLPFVEFGYKIVAANRPFFSRFF